MKCSNDEIMLAESMRKKAYVPYSHFTVGAVLKTKSGKLYTGCNIENHGIQVVCAERVAFCKAISEGEREFESVLVMGGYENKEAERCLPCGYCRQFMSEFVGPEFKIYTVYEGKEEEYTLNDLLPCSFEFKMEE